MGRSRRIRPSKRWKPGDPIEPRKLLCDFNGKKTGQCEEYATDPIYTKPIKDWVGQEDSGQPRWVCRKHARMLRRMGKEVNLHKGTPKRDDPPPLPLPHQKSLKHKPKKFMITDKKTKKKVKARR